MGKLEIKHVRFYDPETKTEYIRWNAPSSLRLLIADKDPKKVVYINATEDKRKDQNGEEKPYFFIKRHAVANERDLK